MTESELEKSYLDLRKEYVAAVARDQAAQKEHSAARQHLEEVDRKLKAADVDLHTAQVKAFKPKMDDSAKPLVDSPNSPIAPSLKAEA